MSIIKSIGATPTERLLAGLCERSFLKLWSYPSPIKDDGKELCDLLAVFEQHVFIFFDRENRQLHELSPDPMINWQRWKRKAVDAQAKTADGAERYIRSGRSIFLDASKKIQFPIRIDLDGIIVHKIVVAHGASQACKEFSSSNISGSLAVAYGDTPLPSPFPFMVEISKENPFHIFDSHTLPIIFGELDTVFDLSAYLDAKLDAVRRYDGLTYCGEEDLLAHYRSANRHFIGVESKDVNFITIGEGEWVGFTKMDVYKRKKAADRESYLWDDLIQRTCQNALDGKLLGHASFAAGQSAMHEMAKEPRFSRRALASQIIRGIQNFPENDAPLMRHVSFMPSYFSDKGYVFLQLKADKRGDYESEYRPKRQALLELACASAKNKFDTLNTVIGIAIDAPKFATTNSEDFCLMDCSDWPEERKRHYENANKGIDFFNTRHLTMTRRRVTEFPSSGSDSVKARKTGRNEKCPCGSGNKYKKCCMPI